MCKLKDWVVWCRSRKKDEEQCPFYADGKGIFSNRSKPAQAKAGEKMDKKGSKGQSVRWKTEQHQMRSERRECLCWVHQECHVVDEEKSIFEESGQSIRRKRRMLSVIERERTRLLDGHRGRDARRLWVSWPSNDR